MAPNNKKKKKPASNPARGFSTVSTPSKPKSISITPAEPQQQDLASENTVAPANNENIASQDQNLSAPRASTTDVHELSPEELERHLQQAELQRLVERGARSKKDSSRQESRLITERRLLRGQAESLSVHTWVHPELLDEIFEAASRDEKSADSSAKNEPTPRTRSAMSEEDLILKLWTLQQTLLKLGFQSAKVDEVLKFICANYSSDGPGAVNKDGYWRLDEAIEWLALHCEPSELPNYDQEVKPQLKEVEYSEDYVQDPKKRRTPRSRQNRRPNKTSTESHTGAQGKVEAVQEQNVDPSSSSESSDDELEPDELIPKFLQLKTKVFKRQPELFNSRVNTGGKGRKGPKLPVAKVQPRPRVAKILKRIDTIEKDVLFDQDEADMQWANILEELKADLAFERREENLRRKAAAAAAAPSAKASEPPKQLKVPDSKIEVVSTEEQADDGLLGGIFADEEGDEKPVELTEDGKPIQIKDFGKWSGVNPRRILEETCKARDGACKLMFKVVSQSPHVVRHQIDVKWTRDQDLSKTIMVEGVSFKIGARGAVAVMESIATPTVLQSESYLSTVVLFLLFAQSAKEEKAYIRLPTIWRELWAGLLVLKKDREDGEDQKAIKKIQDLMLRSRPEIEDEEEVILRDNFKRRMDLKTQAEQKDQDIVSLPVVDPSTFAKIWHEKASTPYFQYMLNGRQELPIWHYKDEILDAVDKNRAVIICSETGSGKSTQIPSFVLEHWLSSGRSCKIYVTEPRRISAISLARRVSEELGERKTDVGTSRSLVGYAIRLESKVSPSSRLIFATTGVVVRMLERPDELGDVTHLVLDEVHERSIDSDFLLVVLRRLMLKRPDLKLILMSATVDAKKFSHYLDGAPILNIPGRTFPVQVQYLEDAVELTKHRISDDYNSIDRSDEVDELEDSDRQVGAPDPGAMDLRAYSHLTRETISKYDEYRLDYSLIVKLLTKIATTTSLQDFSKAILIFMPGIAEIRRLNDEILSHPQFQQGWYVYALHSSIASEDQERAFDVPPQGIRKIVIATNIAETGITIPDITAVIDTGKEKVMRFDERRQLSRLIESFISRANAKQRRGRAGRVQAGLCYHLFTKYRHDNQLSENQVPEMLRLSLQDLVLRIKICNLGDIEQTFSEALDAPSSKNIRRAIDSLKDVKALTNSEELTPLGRQLAKLPLDVFLGKLIVHGAFFNCLDMAVTIAAALSSKSPFVNSLGSNAQTDLARQSFKRGDSDLLTVYNAYLSWKRVRTTPGLNEQQFCRKNCLSPTVLSNIEDLKVQLIVSATDAGLINLNDDERVQLNRARISSRNRQFFDLPPRHDFNSANDTVNNSVIGWSFYPKLLVREGKGWRNVANNQSITLHPSSVNKRSIQDGSGYNIKYLSFYHIMQSKNKFYNAHETSAVEDFAIALMCGDADFKLYAGVLALDSNRLRFSLRDWRTMMAVKILRSKLKDLLTKWFKNPGKALSPSQQQWLQIWQRSLGASDSRQS